MHNADHPSSSPESETTAKCIEILRSLQIRVVVFDMDQTAVAMHSRGRLRRDKLSEYLDKATPAFLHLVPALHAAGFHLAVATHSDEAEFATQPGVEPETHILGTELVMALLQRYFSNTVVQDFCVVAYNPRVRGTASDTTNCIKRYHMRQIMEHFRVKEPSQILFIDDTQSVVQDCNEACGVKAIKIDPNTGLQWCDVLRLNRTE